MSFSDTQSAKKYASIAEVAAAQAKIYADKLEDAPDYAAQAEAAAAQASDSAQSALTAQNNANAAASQAGDSANAAAQSAADAEGAAEAVFGSSLHAPTGEVLSTLPSAAGRVNTVPVFDGAGDAAVKDIADFAILDSNGKIPVSMIPAVALSEVFVVNSQAAMLALDAQEGDVAKRTDLGYSFILASEPASTLSNWVQVSDDVLAQLGLSTGATEVGAVDDDNNSTTVQGALALKASKAYLSATTGATRVNTSSGATVQALFDQLTGGTFNLKYRNYTVYNRLDEELSVASISGVDPTGVADSTAALQGFFNSLPNGSEVYFPAGTYKITGLIISNTSLKIRGAYRYAYGQSTTKIKAGSPNITLMKFTGSGCKIEGLLFEGYEASSANEFGKSTTCKGADFEPATGTLADIDSFVNDCIFWYFQTGVEGHGRNLTVTNTMFTFCRYGIDLYAVTNEQFRGHILNNNRFHSCGGTEASSNSTILGSVCIRLTTANTNTVDNYAGNITILNNVSDGGCYQFFKGPLHRGSILSNNSLFRIGGAGAVVIDIDNSATSSDSSSDLITVTNNNLGAFDLPPYQSGVQYAPDIGIRMTSVRGAIVQVAIDKVYLDAVKLVGCTEVIVHGEVKNPSSIVTQSTATLYSSINIDSNCANITIPYLLTRCTLLSIQLAAYVSTACPTTTVGILDGTANYSTTGPVLEIGSGYVTGDVTAVSARTKKTAISGLITGSNYPVGNYKIGDECKYLNPATTGYKGAVCTVAGNGASATWKNFGALV